MAVEVVACLYAGVLGAQDDADAKVEDSETTSAGLVGELSRYGTHGSPTTKAAWHDASYQQLKRI